MFRPISHTAPLAPKTPGDDRRKRHDGLTRAQSDQLGEDLKVKIFNPEETKPVRNEPASKERCNESAWSV